MLLTKEHFTIGQEVALKHVGNKARYNKGYTMTKVYKISKKYITVAFDEEAKRTMQFILEDNFERDYLLEKSNYSGNFELFPSEQAYLDYEEKQEKLSKIQNAVSSMYNKLNVDQVRRIFDIINE